VFRFLRKLFGQTELTSHPFNREVILARVVNYHMLNHLSPGQKVDLRGCELEYGGGDCVVVAVVSVGDMGKETNHYLHNLVTGATVQR